MCCASSGTHSRNELGLAPPLKRNFRTLEGDWMAWLVLAIVIIEITLAGTWTSFYFRAGLPIFKLRLNHRHIDRRLAERLSSRFCGGLAPDLVFHPLSETEIAFRERMSTLTWVPYSAVMHGLIRSVPEEGTTYVIGWINWFVVAMIGLALWDFLGSSESIPLIYVLLIASIAALIYGVQVYRFRSVGAMVAGRKTLE